VPFVFKLLYFFKFYKAM